MKNSFLGPYLEYSRNTPEPIKLTLMVGVMLVLFTLYGMIPLPYRLVLMPFIIIWIGWFICRLFMHIARGIIRIVRGIGRGE
jgi:hypothetical protein